MDIFYSLGNILILLSLSFRKVIFIRTVFIASDICFLMYGFAINSMPMIYWAIASLGINFVQIYFIIKDLTPKFLSHELQQIKNLFFEHASTSEFLKLIDLSQKTSVTNKIILEKGRPVKALRLITEGSVFIDINGKDLKLGPYHFIGEMSYFSDGNASSTIEARDTVTYLYWNYSDLKNLQIKKPFLFMKMVEAMGKDIVLKMIRNNDKPKDSTED